MKHYSHLFFAILAIISICASCSTNKERTSETELQTERAVECKNILNQIKEYETAHNLQSGPITETKGRFNWGMALVADSIPIAGLAFVPGGGIFAGLFLGILHSALMGWAGGNAGSYTESWPVTTTEATSILPPEYGVIHNAVLSTLMNDAVNDSTDTIINDEWFFNRAITLMNQSFPNDTLTLSFLECQQLMAVYPDAREYDSFYSYQEACYLMMPEQEDLLNIVFQVQETIAAQESEEEASAYVDAVIQIIEESSLPDEDIDCLVGTISVAEASNEYWDEQP